MSSRSNGVTKVAFTRRAISCVISSASCSASRIREAIALRSAPSLSISARIEAPSTILLADC
jgi:hypothetical protein